MDSSVIIIIVVVLGISVVGFIISVSWMARKKKEAQGFMNDLASTHGILHFSGSKLLIDGRETDPARKTRNQEGIMLHAVEPGEHQVVCRLEFTDISFGKNRNNKTEDITFTALFEAGKQ